MPRVGQILFIQGFSVASKGILLTISKLSIRDTFVNQLSQTLTKLIFFFTLIEIRNHELDKLEKDVYNEFIRSAPFNTYISPNLVLL